MNKKYIKRPIPEEISEDGGASVVFVDKETVPLDGSIADALAGNYCTGNRVLIQNLFFGLMRSMAEGVVRDGHARQIGDFLTVYPVFKGEIDLDKGFDPATNYIQVRARLLNEMELDITNWAFQDVTPGRRAFRLNTVKAGAIDGVILLTEAVELNGKDMPSTKAGETIRIDWAVDGTALSGTIPAAKVTSDVSRADIAADALAALNAPANDGKTIVFTVRGNFANAKISGILKAVPTTITKVTSSFGDFPETAANEIYDAENVNIYGTQLKLSAGDRVTFSGKNGGADVSGFFDMSDAFTNENGKLVLDYGSPTGATFTFDANTTVKLAVKGVEVNVLYKGQRPS